MVVQYSQNVWNNVYEGETEEEKKKREEEERKKAEGQTYTQEQFNKALAEDRRKHKAQVDKAVADLENLKKQKGMSDEAKAALENQIEEMKNQLLTKEEMADKEKKRIENEYKVKIEETTKDKDHWRQRYEKETIKRALSDAAVLHKAYNNEQIVKFLQNETHLVEETKEDGTRTYTPKVKFEGKDKEGKIITLDLPVEEAVKRMKEEPQKYGNLFVSEITGGLGGSGNNNNRGGDQDLGKMSPEQYKKYRDEKLGRAKK